MDELNEKELDISYAAAFLREWLKVDMNKSPVLRDNLEHVIHGVKHYRDKYIESEERFAGLQERYNQLTALSSQYLMLIQQLREQNEQLLIDSQRPEHIKDAYLLE